MSLPLLKLDNLLRSTAFHYWDARSKLPSFRVSIFFFCFFIFWIILIAIVYFPVIFIIVRQLHLFLIFLSRATSPEEIVWFLLIFFLRLLFVPTWICGIWVLAVLMTMAMIVIRRLVWISRRWSLSWRAAVIVVFFR